MISQIPPLLEQNRKLYKEYPSHLKRLRERVQSEIRTNLDLDVNSPFVVTGHQVEFFHPGILSKEIISSMIAQETAGSSISIILDHDHRDIEFTYPYIENIDNEPRIRKKTYLCARESKFYKSLDPVDKDNFSKTLRQIRNNLKEFYTPDQFRFLHDNLVILENNLVKHEVNTDFIIESRKESLKKNNINFFPLKVSTLAALNCWREFCKIITDDIDHFRKVHNDALGFYRTAHHIKNHAQPVPDLHDNELPFWLAENKEVKTKAYKTDIGKEFLPRAITLSIFLRLFAADIFIHGRGGGRYDLVTNQIIKNFFNVEPSDFIVKTATHHLPVLHNPAFQKIYKMMPLSAWELHYRNFLYHPERILDKKHHLLQERFSLINEFNSTKGSRKLIHNKLEENRQNIQLSMESTRNGYLEEKNQIRKYTADKLVLTDRTFPYFFYDLSETFHSEDFEVISYRKPT